MEKIIAAQDIADMTGLSRSTIQRRINEWIKNKQLTPIKSNPYAKRRQLTFNKAEIEKLLRQVE